MKQVADNGPSTGTSKILDSSAVSNDLSLYQIDNDKKETNRNENFEHFEDAIVQEPLDRVCCSVHDQDQDPAGETRLDLDKLQSTDQNMSHSPHISELDHGGRVFKTSLQLLTPLCRNQCIASFYLRYACVLLRAIRISNRGSLAGSYGN